MATGMSCAASPCTYADTDGLVSGTPYYYVVRATDLSNGVEETNLVERSGTPTGPNVAQTPYLDDFDGNRTATALKLANKKVFKSADNREDYTGMGTTVVAALASGNVLTIGSAGDSRCYLWRGGQLSQLTRDDSWVSAAWAEGIMSTEEIEKHPLRNVITKAIGAKESIEIDIVEHRFADGDIALLCSDGLHR